MNPLYMRKVGLIHSEKIWLRSMSNLATRPDSRAESRSELFYSTWRKSNVPTSPFSPDIRSAKASH
ncbi:hypothetical protein HOLleu_33231 [Holothuria leucospilota]|uniref:Uncharacterized protein n=1 Tax=Holothuria leucospilota TaxID=206669 RepID=A0A9Q1BHY9_HOLLE|nr:hypothetical protein HOLleu_33231 [Holothuria leucospilota]